MTHNVAHDMTQDVTRCRLNLERKMSLNALELLRRDWGKVKGPNVYCDCSCEAPLIGGMEAAHWGLNLYGSFKVLPSHHHHHTDKMGVAQSLG